MINAYYFYKLANQFYKMGVPFFPGLLKLIIFLVYNSAIPFSCSIGKKTRFAYGGIGVILHKDCVIGSNVLIGSNVVIGGKEGVVGVPKIGDNVKLATGSKILGNITIGKNAVIGANSVVLKNIPENAIAAGIPARIIRIQQEPINEDFNNRSHT